MALMLVLFQFATAPQLPVPRLHATAQLHLCRCYCPMQPLCSTYTYAAANAAIQHATACSTLLPMRLLGSTHANNSAIWGRKTHARTGINPMSTDNKALQVGSGKDPKTSTLGPTDMAGLGVAPSGTEESPRTASECLQAASHQETP